MPGDGLGTLASSLFEEKGREEYANRIVENRPRMPEIAAELQRRRQLTAVENDDPSGGDQEMEEHRRELSSRLETRLIQRKYEEKKDRGDQELEHAKEELRAMSGYDTVHPSRWQRQGLGGSFHHTLHHGSDEITDVT